MWCVTHQSAFPEQESGGLDCQTVRRLATLERFRWIGGPADVRQIFHAPGALPAEVHGLAGRSGTTASRPSAASSRGDFCSGTRGGRPA